MRLSRKEFSELVSRALDDVPDEFLEKLENLYVTVEDWPSAEDRRAAQLGRGMTLLGLYHGVPLGERSSFAPVSMPDRITLYQRPIESLARSREEAVQIIRRTVLHEIAHHFGFSEERLRDLGY